MEAASVAAVTAGAARRRPGGEPSASAAWTAGKYMALERDKRKRARPIPTGPERSFGPVTMLGAEPNARLSGHRAARTHAHT